MDYPNLEAAAFDGMSLAYQAARNPERVAIYSRRGQRSFAELEARVNQLARALRAAGLRRGDGVALVCSNRVEFAEVFFAAQRSGVRLTPVNWHLTAEEVAYVVADCGAKALVIESRFAQAAGLCAAAASSLALRVAVDGALPGFEDYEKALAGHPGDTFDAPSLGDAMLYTSGTTGRPKGVRRPLPDPRKAVPGSKLLVAAFDFRPGESDLTLATGPLYHSGPINLCLSIPISNGIPTILMEKWDAESMLRLIDERAVTHTFCVPTMFRRLLSLPEATRRRYDVSSLRFIIHGAAPCPVEDKLAIIDWFGPILTELYAATEGMGTLVSSEEWLKHPGTVGRPVPENIRIVDGRGREVPVGEIGTVFLRPVGGADFEYHGDPEKTRSAKRDGFFSVGDLGYLDEEGYLFLTGRSAELIITGGTNVYPAEIDAALLGHPLVRDAAAVGVADEEWGEVAKAVVVPDRDVSADASLEASILEHCRRLLPTFKTPRSVDFVDEIPRSEAGKVLRRKLRDRYEG